MCQMSRARKWCTHCHLYMWNRWRSVNMEIEINGSYININNSSHFQLEPLIWPSWLHVVRSSTCFTSSLMWWWADVTADIWKLGLSCWRTQWNERQKVGELMNSRWCDSCEYWIKKKKKIWFIPANHNPTSHPSKEKQTKKYRRHTFLPAVIYRTVKRRRAASAPFVSWLS